MADLSTYTNKFRADGPVQKEARNAKVIKRTRQKLSCIPCATRKLKCDRGQPCQTCVNRRSKDVCFYEKTSALTQGSSRPQTYEKLASLEQLVRQMMNSEASRSQNRQPPIVIEPQHHHTPPDEIEWTNEAGPQIQSALSVPSPSHTPLSQPQSKPNRMSPSAGDEGHPQATCDTGYKGSTHWSAILDNIQELKVAMQSSPDVYAEEDDIEIPQGEMLFGASAVRSLQQILSESLPPRVQVDRRLSSFFQAKTMIVPYIHTGYFQRQYQTFWTNPSAATISRDTQSEPSRTEYQQNDRIKFIAAAAQCIILSGYTRPRPYVVEALALYAQCKYMHGLDPSRELCIILSNACRLAYMMGYHRDPDHYGNFTAFEGEMRRRAWSACRQFDLMVSFQFGLPSNIHTDSLDTKSPRNLLDSDFDENTLELPPSRPETEATPILYFVVKHNLLEGFTRVCNHALSLTTKSQAEILELDAELQKMYSSIPENLRIRPMAQSLADPPFLVITRLYIAFLHQKCLCILHRGHMAQGHEYSTKACIDAATTIITHFIDVNKEFEVGGQLYGDRWALSSFNMNDFLLAVMILCLSLSIWRRRNSEKTVSEDCDARSQLNLLKQAYAVCIEKATTSKESRRVVAAVATVLAQLETQENGPVNTYALPLEDSNGDDITPVAISHPGLSRMVMTPTSPIYDIGIGDMAATSSTFYNSDAEYTLPSINLRYVPAELGELSRADDWVNPFQDIFNDFENMDWTYMDQCLVGSNLYEQFTELG